MATKSFDVHLTAFATPGKEIKIRKVEIPEDEVITALENEEDDELLELVFRYGQNDVQAVDGCYSVSVGDLVDLRGQGHGVYLVKGMGFKRISPMERVRIRAAAKAGRDGRLDILAEFGAF